MKPQIKLITLGVDNLERSLVFYRDGLGLPTQGIIGTEFEDGAVVFFNLANDMILGLYPRPSLAKDANLPLGSQSPTGFSIGHNVSSKSDVDAVMKQAEAAGARITNPARDQFWGGYSGYFQDPDGHLWEVAWNPAWEEDSNRRPSSIALGAAAVGALAVGALAIGALAIGRLAIGKLAVGKTRLQSLEVGDLSVGEMKVDRLIEGERKIGLR
jgi:catechol 2,3-dioxygenase-like lactoylglutathione lyase family enzyme